MPMCVSLKVNYATEPGPLSVTHLPLGLQKQIPLGRRSNTPGWGHHTLQ